MRLLTAALALASLSHAGVAVTLDGRVYRGEIGLEKNVVSITSDGTRKEHSRDDFSLIENDDGSLVWAADLPARVRAYEYLARDDRSRALAALTGKAVSARNAALARRILELALAEGWTDAGAKVEQQVEELERSRHEPDPAKTAAVEEQLASIRRFHPELLASRAALELQKAASSRAGLVFLRESLRLDSAGSRANELLAKTAPKAFRLGDARAWLDWQLDLHSAGARLPTSTSFELREAIRNWRKDVHEVRAGPIQLITPIKEARSIGRCLAYGRLACRALGAMFATEKPTERSTEALTLFLYESREEYLTESGTPYRVEDRAGKETAAGHYDPIAGISRFHWSAGRFEERHLAATAVHELTHHWVELMNPRFADVDLVNKPRMWGYWIVEGFASMMGEGRYDVERGRWFLFDPRSRSLDIVQALAAEEKLIPWPLLYRLSYVRFRQLPTKPNRRVVRRWSMGERPMSTRRLFYEQAAATCLFLYHADGGQRRQQLLDYVTAYYTGNAKGLEVEVAFKLTGAQLGEKVTAFAHAVRRGWRPR